MINLCLLEIHGRPPQGRKEKSCRGSSEARSIDRGEESGARWGEHAPAADREIRLPRGLTRRTVAGGSRRDGAK